MSEFIWSEQYVLEFMGWFASTHSPKEQMEKFNAFKASKQPKPEWEIIACGDGMDVRYDWRGKTEAPSKYPILSVKRLSDGETFTVGDEVGLINMDYVGQIKSFEIGRREEMLIRFHHSIQSGLKYVYKKKVPKELGDYIPVYLTPSQLEKLLTILNTTK